VVSLTLSDYSDTEVGQLVHYLMIDDLTYSMKKPCIIDLKMGTREYSDHDSKKKQIQKVILSSVTASNSLGFRICGMKVWKVKEKHFGTQSKKKALLLNTHQVEESLVAFIDNGKKIRTEVYKKALEKLNQIKQWFEEQTTYCFYASSILILYDGEVEDGEVVVKMIDFAHTQKSKKKKDESYLFGLNHLTSTLQDIVDLKLQYKKGGKGCLTFPEIENITNSISSMQSNIDSIVARNANVGKNLDVKKRFEVKLKEKDEVIEALRIELETLRDTLEMPKKMNHLEQYAAMMEKYETKLKLKDSIIEQLTFDLKNSQELIEQPKEEEEEEKKETLKDQIIVEKNSLIQSLTEFNEKLKKRNQQLLNNKETFMYSKILTLQDEFEEIQYYKERELKELQRELEEKSIEMKEKEKEIMKWKQLAEEREEELKEAKVKLEQEERMKEEEEATIVLEETESTMKQEELK
jgi:hypothetical protein